VTQKAGGSAATPAMPSAPSAEDDTLAELVARPPAAAPAARPQTQQAVAAETGSVEDPDDDILSSLTRRS
jgi:hypothetical protein